MVASSGNGGSALTAGVRAGVTAPLAATALAAGAVFFGGGSGGGSVPVLGSLAVAAAAAALVLAALGLRALPRLDAAGRIAALALAGLVAWAGLSIAWSIAGDRSWEALAKALVVGAFALAGLAVAASGRGALRLLAGGLAAVLGVALLWALLGVAVPALFPEGDRIARLREPVGYWNGLALLADAALVLGMWLATALRSPPARAAGGLLAYGAVLALLLTQSRAGLVAGLAVVGLWLVLSPARLEGALVLLAATIPAALVGGWAFTRDALVEDGAARAERVSDGAVFGALAAPGAAAVAALLLAVPLARLAQERRGTVVRVLAAGGAALVLAAGAALVARVGDPVEWARDQFSRGECVNDPRRLAGLCANNRLEWWREAVDVWRANRVAGTGAHTFEIARKRVRDEASDVSEPHSVPLQLLADTGLVGLALALALAGAAAVGIARAPARLAGEERAAATALVALPAAWALHALVDYDLDFLAVTGPAALVAFALLGAGRPPARPVLGGWLGAAAIVAAALAVVAVLVTPRLAERQVDRAYRLYDEGRLEEAAATADRARSLDPLALAPVLAAAAVEERRRNPSAARALYREAVDLQPENPEAWYQLGLFELDGRDDACAAYFALNEAYTLDQKGRQWVPGGPLDVARDAVDNERACG